MRAASTSSPSNQCPDKKKAWGISEESRRSDTKESVNMKMLALETESCSSMSAPLPQNLEAENF